MDAVSDFISSMFFRSSTVYHLRLQDCGINDCEPPGASVKDLSETQEGDGKSSVQVLGVGAHTFSRMGLAGGDLWEFQYPPPLHTLTVP